MAKKGLIAPRYRLKMKQRLAIVSWAMEHGIKPAGAPFGLDRKTIREWRDRYRAQGLVGLVPTCRSAASPACPRRSSCSSSMPAASCNTGRTRIWLRRVHQKNVPMATIARTFVRMGLPYLPRGRKRTPRPRQFQLFKKPNPGDSVQMDVNVVKLAGPKAYQDTAIDDCTLERGLPRRGSPGAAAPDSEVAVYNGTEFAFTFALTVQKAGSEQNGQIERSHRIDTEEFWRGRRRRTSWRRSQPSRPGSAATTSSASR